MDASSSSARPSSDPAVAVDPVDVAVDDLRAARQRWAGQDDEARAALLDACRERFASVSGSVVASGLAMKGLDPGSAEAAEEWAFVLGTLKLFRVYAAALRDTARHGRPLVRRWSELDGRVVAHVAPADVSDRVALLGGRGEVRLQPGVTLAEAQMRQGARWRARPPTPPVMVILGAGNVPLLIPGDVLHAIFLAHHVVVLKLNPVNEALAPWWRTAFAPLVEAGALRIVTGAAAVGARLCTHPGVDAIHMTGSHHTYAAVAFGGPRTPSSPMASVSPMTPTNARPITAELGNVTPVIVVPGPWTPAELRYHAVQLGSQHGLNAAHNCLTPRLLVLARGWSLRDAFLDELRRFFASVPPRRAYYPGSASRHERFLAAHPDAVRLGAGSGDVLPWTLVTGLRSEDTEELCFREESFCAVLAEATVDAADVPTFLARAVDFVNDRVWGNLTATLLVHPATQRDPVAARAVEHAVAGLRYGSVAVNTFGSLVYATPSLPWGAFPGNAPADIQSGVGFVNNVLDVPAVEKAVVYAPFAVGRQPPLDLRWRAGTRLLQAAAGLEHHVNVRDVARVVGALVEGAFPGDRR